MSNWKDRKKAASGSSGSKETSNTKSSGGSSSGKPMNITLLDIRTVDTAKGLKSKVQFAKDVEIYYQGEKVDLGEYNSAFLKTKDELIEDLDFYVENEFMTEERAQSQLDFIDEKAITSRLQVKM